MKATLQDTKFQKHSTTTKTTRKTRNQGSSQDRFGISCKNGNFMNELYLSEGGPPSIRAIYLRIKNVKNYLHAAKFAEFVLVSFSLRNTPRSKP
jgi:hypothetical protein